MDSGRYGARSPRKTELRAFLVEVPLVVVRTGHLVDLSAARLSWIPTTVLAKCHTTPQIAYELAQLVAQRHRLIQVGQEIPE